MKHILLMRHADSSPDESGQKDFDRPLSKRGLKDAPAMGRLATNRGYTPDLILSSPARRARQTAELVAEASGLPKDDIRWVDDFYKGSGYHYLEEIQQCHEALDTILLVGHNPNMEEIVSMLCSNRQDYTARMTPAALVCVEHPAVEWDQVKEGTARITWMVTPRFLRKG